MEVIRFMNSTDHLVILMSSRCLLVWIESIFQPNLIQKFPNAFRVRGKQNVTGCEIAYLPTLQGKSKDSGVKSRKFLVRGLASVR